MCFAAIQFHVNRSCSIYIVIKFSNSRFFYIGWQGTIPGYWVRICYIYAKTCFIILVGLRRIIYRPRQSLVHADELHRCNYCYRFYVVLYLMVTLCWWFGCCSAIEGMRAQYSAIERVWKLHLEDETIWCAQMLSNQVARINDTMFRVWIACMTI